MVAAVFADFTRAPIAAGLRETLRFLQKVTLRPEAVGPEDAARALDAGVSVEALVDALYVCAYFNLIDRLADALGWHVPPEEEFAAGAADFLAEGYGNEV